MKVRISRRVIGHLEGSDAWQSGQRAVASGHENQSTVDMMEAIKAASRRKDGSVTVDLDDDQRATLYEYADVMAIGARDNVTPPGDPYGDNDALSDLNAARALMRQLKE
ncbi:hypothetical protein SEA_BIGSWOLE_153 [Mycobacterium phage Bigswole]|uniref:Uncharacterized protein n=1 Tax=Mycobacterium phage Bigswole TaxID=2041521 RepID=A0A2D1G818_9CAUD|nr:hypothetical protein KHO58_gp177 [Mycobacterium phage Bigswole]ATN87822.1 hypothetical protein SEA_BIGSWOLE_153 [Mycobacterium phage Bigswole]